MSFLSKFTGNKAADSFVDQAVDKAGEFLMPEKLKKNFKIAVVCKVFILFILRLSVSSFNQPVVMSCF